MTAPRAARWLRAVEIALFIVAVCALGVYAAARVAAMRDQAQLSSELGRHTVAAAVSEPGRTSPARARQLARGSLVGRLEVPRLNISVVAL
jgi:hypothetical protein